ncbi:MAG: Molybdopterin-synthase adenylyltransferase [uncultured Thermomicrobiales bacterium]|uniref:Molybdopterin-synthase adenylyltransferase n=1 Tax=uncultured Thermomicrobiales bacterium TaxID=1645740 RepID=A0A6J4UH51_9BACT|nr:MAG: Molybdopterin-synthase adenylyltransferase [uncultured Thermomicrobiales bacterium]
MSARYNEILQATKRAIREVDATEARKLIDQGAAAVDVREQDEVDQGVVPGSIHIPRGFLEQRIEDAVPEHSQTVVVYCAGGVRSAFAAKSLNELGYTDVVSLAGGFNGWKNAGEAWHVPATLTSDQRRRYSRHLLIPEVGEAGQHKLIDAKVLLVGAGGLGSPAALYLAAAGIGTIGIIDADTVDDSNLQRQVAHTLDRVGMPKVESAKIAMQGLNPDLDVVTYQVRLTKENALDIFAGYDVIVDGADNFATRYLINDVCVLLDKPNVHGSVFRFEGQASVFLPHQGPCYRCLFPDPPPPELAPSCAEAGVLGVLPGTIGLLQATETVKLILGIGEPLVGRLLLYDALATEFRELRLKRNPACPVCGDGAHVDISTIEYTDAVCAVPSLASAAD